MRLHGGAFGEGILSDGGFRLMKPIRGAVNEQGGEGSVDGDLEMGDSSVLLVI